MLTPSIVELSNVRRCSALKFSSANHSKISFLSDPAILTQYSGSLRTVDPLEFQSEVECFLRVLFIALDVWN
ncbi:hypothetical protein Y1Q_0017228 [Alligator mississippiensis]|uniref:Uncharacterized protein n=1 Tax=Alligator mississippiensis TaxID=8496 RepID=A0A151NKT9_ALLMI|nr:hypothetical protein Y1Q_0017228 [Alligator mississippiensis]